MANMFNKATLLLIALLLAVVATMPASAETNRVLLAEDGTLLYKSNSCISSKAYFTFSFRCVRMVRYSGNSCSTG